MPDSFSALSIQHSAVSVGILAADLSDRHGWAHYSLSLVRALADAGIPLTVIAARNSPPLDGVRVLPLLPSVEPLDSGMLVGTLRALPQVRAALGGCTLIHSLVEPYAPLAALVAGRRPLLVTGHGSYVLTPERRRFPVSTLYAWAFRRSLLVCVSNYTARAAQRVLPGIRTKVVNNGVRFERFADIQHSGGGGVLTVGAVKARKGTLELVRAMADVPGVSCRIVGTLDNEPGYVERVRREIETLGLSDRVTLLGRVPEADLMRLYAEADLYVLASRNDGWKFEGFGLSLLEASAAGLPVIGTTDCGAEDAVLDGITGLLVPQNSVEQDLPAAITRLLSDRALAARMGAAGRDYARSQSWDQVAQQMIALYKAAVSS